MDEQAVNETSFRPHAHSDKSRLIAVLLCFFLGALGVHRFYLGRTRSAVFMLLTLGGLGLWSLVDLILLLLGKLSDADGHAVTDWSMAKPRQGLVIRTHALEYLALRGQTVVQSVCVPIENWTRADLTRALQRLVNQVSLKLNNIPIAISSPDVVFRYFQLPVMPQGEIDNAVKFEARKYLPFKPEDLVWDYAVETQTKSGRMNILFGAMPKDTFQIIDEALNAMGIVPSILEPRSLSLARSASLLSADASEGILCVVETQAYSAHIVLTTSAGMPYLARDVSLELKHEATALTPESAEMLSAQAGVQAADEGQDQALHQLLREIGVSVDFLAREYGTSEIARVLLCGDEHVIGQWHENLRARLRSPVVIMQMPTDSAQRVLSCAFAASHGVLQGRGSKLSLNLFKRHASDLSAPSGVSKLSGLSAELNLANSQELLQAFLTPQTAVFGVLALGLLIALSVFCSQWHSQTQAELKRLQASQTSLGWGLETVDVKRLQSMRVAALDQLGALKVWTGNRISLAAKMDALARSLPEGLWVDKLSYTDRVDKTLSREMALSMDGACFLDQASSEIESIQSFERALRKHEAFVQGFESVHLGRIFLQVDEQQKYNYRGFELSCKSKRTL